MREVPVTGPCHVVLACLLAFWASSPPRAAAQADCSAHATVQEWNGTLDYSWAADYQEEDSLFHRRHGASVHFHLTRQTPNFPGITRIGFEGPGIGTASIHDTITDLQTGDVVSWDGSGTPVHDGGQGGINLTLDLATCEYSYFWSVNVWDAGGIATIGLGKLQAGGRGVPDGVPVPLQDSGNFPARGLFWLFQGLTEDAYVAVLDLNDPPAAAHVGWSLVPGPPEELELLVEIPAYADWLPEGGPDELTPAEGKELEIKATLQKKGGGAPTYPPQSIRFELLSRSSEKGVAVNFPERSKLENPAKPDLRFDPVANASRRLEVPDADGNMARTLLPPSDSKASALLSTYDWGGYGILEVTAVAADGQQIKGHFASDPPEKTRIEIPKRTLPSRVADSWKSSEGVPDGFGDADDSEAEPVGDGGLGDGISLYEEYRGLLLNGQHSRKQAQEALDPLQKDVFVRNCIGAEALAGIAKFRSRTGLRVHARIRDGELPAGSECPEDVDFPAGDRVINSNSADPAVHLVDQHAIVLIANPGADANRARGGPGLPREVRRVVIADSPGIEKSAKPGGKPQIDAAKRGRYIRTVAHELAHSVNVYHHGSGDRDEVLWRLVNGVIVEQGLDRDSAGEPVLVGGARQIVVRSEAGALLSAADLGLPSVVYIGVQKGQHSGEDDCVMRYEDAEAFEPAVTTTPATRYWVGSEITGDQMCAATDGTGVNDAKERPSPPGPRYGDADVSSERGDCLHQVRVSDALPGVAR